MLKTRYDKAEVNVDKIAQMLEDHQIILTKDVAMLDQMYQMNLGTLSSAFHVYRCRKAEAGGSEKQ